MTLEAIRYQRGKLEVLDQLLLPIETCYIPVKNTADGWQVINLMQVRGAPAIAIVSCLSLAVELEDMNFRSKEHLSEEITKKLQYLVTARPTAVNMRQAAEFLTTVVQELLADESVDTRNMKLRIVESIEQMLVKDLADNKAIGDHGAKHILQHCQSRPVQILTHCNTGSLATSGYGTALGVIRSLKRSEHLEHVFCTETRPYNQGARLTAYELVHDQIPATLICDNMVAALMKSKQITAVVVGADRVVANGDTANKIGTYQLAILAKHHGVPFYVAAPYTTIDFNLKTGDCIPIEERPHLEMTHVMGNRIAAPGINCWNPAFDITDADLITGGIITEFGVFPSHKIPRQQ